MLNGSVNWSSMTGAPGTGGETGAYTHTYTHIHTHRPWDPELFFILDPLHPPPFLSPFTFPPLFYPFPSFFFHPTSLPMFLSALSSSPFQFFYTYPSNYYGPHPFQPKSHSSPTDIYPWSDIPVYAIGKVLKREWWLLHFWKIRLKFFQFVRIFHNPIRKSRKVVTR